ncbi:uncharacterized protein LOC134184109 [Corticium candelabrum]|uniref:uncharacterized protein LOC134184109 n=1 Tax=Corticium candelabrum TaxID=121492 RepID=UPI002E2F8726|nr:uncharacterized protein LOC134184109 [Corticium candelabrum]
MDEAHTGVQWGTACQNVSEEEEPFRVWCGLVGELRSLLDVPCLALTATASASTRKALTLALGLRNAVEIVKSPDRPNVHLSVKRVAPDFETTFDWLLRMIQTLGVACPRVLVYCRTQNACASLYLHFKHTLGKRAFSPEGETLVENRLVEMYHSSTPEANKEAILTSLRAVDGKCRVVFATNALGLGIDVKGLHTVVHWGPANTLESYMQEIGRCGRDGGQSRAVLYYHGQQLQHIDFEMRQYLFDSDTCRRKLLLLPFGAPPVQPETQHQCCDVCARTCSCAKPSDCSGIQDIFWNSHHQEVRDGVHHRSHRPVSLPHIALIQTALLEYKEMEEEIFTSSVQQPQYSSCTHVRPISDDCIHEILSNLTNFSQWEDILNLVPELNDSQSKDIIDLINYVLTYE